MDGTDSPATGTKSYQAWIDIDDANKTSKFAIRTIHMNPAAYASVT